MSYNKFESRDFNRISVDKERNTITKTSKKKQKLLDEANWYSCLPEELSPFVPKLHNVLENDDEVSIVMDLFSYPNLAYLWLKSCTDFDKWSEIIDHLFKIHNQIEQYSTDVDINELNSTYNTKTIERLKEIIQDNSEIAEMMSSNVIIINGKTYKNFSVSRGLVFEKIQDLIKYNRRTIVHGDFCFSNILMDTESNSFRFVDPRGGFGKTSIYGDPRYDIAKLRHSFVGLYDFIIADLFKLEKIGDNSFNFHVKVDLDIDKYEKFFDSIAVKYGYVPDDIKFIEGLLFLTMIPLHVDKPEHQKSFYLIAIQKLNEVIYGE